MQTLNLGAQIAHYRKQLGMTQEALASRLGVTNQAVSKWESEQSCPDVQLLPELADLFEISLDTLFGRAAPAAGSAELPWEDDETLHAVLYLGRRLQGHGLLDCGRREAQTVELHWTGAAERVQSAFSVVCENCTISGDIHAGDSVTCGDINGNVSAGDGVNCGNVTGIVIAGDGVNCGDVGGDVHAGDGVRCGNVGGSVFSGED